MAGRLNGIRDTAALMVAVTLVGAMVVGAVGSDRHATAATTTTHRVTIPAAAFTSTDDANDYLNYGADLTGFGAYVAPVSFYRPGDRVRVMNMTLFYTDDSPADVCATLIVATAGQGAVRAMGDQVCSTGAASGVRSLQMRTVKPRNVTEYQAAFVHLSFSGSTLPTGLWVHGVRITYRVTE